MTFSLLRDKIASDMWEVLVRTPRGNTKPRKLSLLLATLLLASFGYIFGFTPTAHAVSDAEWDNQTIRYNGHVYDVVPDTADLPSNISSSPAVYQYVDSAKTPKIVHFIYFKNTPAQSEKEATYVRYTLNPPNDYSDEAGKKTISITPVPADEQANTENDTDLDPTDSSCTIDGIGWMVCPLMNGIAEGMDFIFEKIRGFLVVQPMTTDVNNPVYRIWQVSRDLANMAFVIGFLIIIYNYIVGGGMSGYEIRKIIPRLVIAAILINISYIICAAAVDISNIMGYGVNQLFESVRDSTLPGAVGEGDINWTSVTTWVLAGGTGAIAGTAVLATSVGGAATGLWFLLAPFLLGAALVVMVTFLILAARQAIIVLAIAIAPLAFAAYILPNTEKWFEKWRGLFFTMLVMFPAFAAVFGGAQLAGEMMIRMAAANGSIELIILGLGVMVAPLAITPLLLKLGGGLLGRIGGMINNKEKGLVDRYKNYNKERLADHVARNNARNAEMRANGTFGRRQLARRYAARAYAKNNYRSTQRKLNEEAAENAWHNQHGRWGYDSHVAPHGMDDNLSRRNQGGRGSLDYYKRDNQLRHNLTEAQHEEHWQQTLNADLARRQMLTDTRLAEGRGKVIQGAHEAQDERTLRTALHEGNGQYTALRQMQVQSTVDSSFAEAMKGRLDTEGKLEFKQEFTGSSDAARALRRAFNETKVMEKEISVIDTTLEKGADAYWERTSKQDNRLRNLRLQAIEATDSATKYEEQWNKLIANIRAKGDQAPDITLSSDKTIANNIRQLGQDIEVEKWAQESAKRVQQANMSAELKANNALRAYAGGVGGEAAANRIYAKAKKDIVSGYLEDVENSRSVLSEYSLKELIQLHQNGRDRDNKDVSTNEALRDAAMREILLTKGNNWAYQRTKDYVSALGMNYDEDDNAYYELVRDDQGFVKKDATGKPLKGARITNQEEIDRRRDVQQLFVDSAKNSKLAIKSFSGTDRGNAEVGTFFLESQEAIIRDINDKKINASRLAQTDVDELQRTVQILRDDDIRSRLDESARVSLIKTIEFALTDPQVRASIGDREAELMQVISNYAGDRRRSIPMETKVAYETYAKTKAPTTFKIDRVHDFDDGKGPNGLL